MGFNKRIIKKEILLERFRLEGYQGIINYIGNADALLGLTDEIREILDITYCDNCPTKKNVDINKVINGKGV